MSEWPWIVAALITLTAASVGCVVEGSPGEVRPLRPFVATHGQGEYALTASALLSMNGTYGAGCIDRAGESWSVLIDPGATPDNETLSVLQRNVACQLTLTALRTGPGPSDLHVASPPIVLSDAFAVSGSAFLPGGAPPLGFYANAKLGQVDFAADFAIDVVVSADPAVGIPSAPPLVSNGLVGLWALNHASGTTATDTSGAGHDGTLTNMAGSEWTAGPAGNALAFDGTNDYVSIGNIGAAAKSVSFWMKTPQVSVAQAPTATGSPAGTWTSGNNAYASDNAYASTAATLAFGLPASESGGADWVNTVGVMQVGTSAGGCRQKKPSTCTRDYGFVFSSLPTNATILGIRVMVNARVLPTTEEGYVTVSVLKNSVLTATSPEKTITEDTYDNFYLGSPAVPDGTLEANVPADGTDLWGQTWTRTELNTAGVFKVRLTGSYSKIGTATEELRVEYMKVVVYYSVRQDYSTFGLTVPAGAVISGIQATVEAKGTVASIGSLAVSLSGDGGSSYTSSETISYTTADDSYTLGGATNLWGDTWTAAKVNDTNFRLRLTMTPEKAGTVSVDSITARVFWTAPIIDLNGAGAQIAASATPALVPTGLSAPSVYVNCVAGSTITTGAWQHVIVTDATGVSASAVKLGGTGANYFDGMLDEVRIYDRVLSGSEICVLTGMGDAGVGGDDAGVDAGADAGADAGVDAGNCAGVPLYGLCWYIGSTGQSCNTVCGSHGGYDTSATSYIGSTAQGGSVAECSAIMTALGQAGAVSAGNNATGYGCHDYSGTKWVIANTAFAPSASSPYAKIACACAN